MGKAMFLAMSWGAILGRVTTYLGAARNILAVGLLERKYNLNIGFFEWIKDAFPLLLIILVVTFPLIIKEFMPGIADAKRCVP